MVKIIQDYRHQEMCWKLFPRIKTCTNTACSDSIKALLPKMQFSALCMYWFVLIPPVCVSAGYCNGLPRIWDGKGKAVTRVNSGKVFAQISVFLLPPSKLQHAISAQPSTKSQRNIFFPSKVSFFSITVEGCLSLKIFRFSSVSLWMFLSLLHVMECLYTKDKKLFKKPWINFNWSTFGLK